ncbi:uncharacterized protein LOC122505130 [Leptopilina heterotoma]|uniref:uncharacterized protein LOC122505130 n=1 Tax=Leptopilina heterotoma TaxID=63436 RepID=UPI001CA7BBBF|nr:uncharacterized protein LOC122505130 [Leptopilina heterotoma]
MSIFTSPFTIGMAEILCQHGAVLSDNDLINMAPLCNAVSKGNFEMVKLLMAKECNKVDISTKGGSPLELAVSSGRLDILEYLMINGVKSIATVKEDKLGLFRSLIFQGGLETLTFLVDIGIKAMNLDEVFNATFYSGRHDMWKYLVTRLSKINANTYFKETQLHLAIRMGQLETVKAIVNEPSNEYESDTFARKLSVYIAVENDNEEILEILLNAGYPVTDSLFKCISPLHLAATFEHPRLVKLLLEAGADVNLQTEDYHHTPLHFAATAAQPAVVKFLLDHGADPSKTSTSGELPLKTALKIHSGPIHVFLSITPSVFEELVKVTDMLIQYSNSKSKEDLLIDYAAGIRVSSSINNSKPKSKRLISAVGDSVFRPEIVRSIFNYLSEKEIIKISEIFLLECDSSDYPPELFQLMMEYNIDVKSCFDIKIYTCITNDKSKLLLIGYSRNVRNLLGTLSEIINDYDEDENDAEKKIKIELLKLLFSRLVLLNTNCDLTPLEDSELNDLIVWQENCIEEKSVMQSTKVNENLNFTFYDVLTKSMDKVAGYANNEDFLTAVKFSQIKFPIYADFLKGNVEIAERRRNCIDKSTTLMYRMVKNCYRIQISTSDIRHILQYLSIVDLRKFSAACAYIPLDIVYMLSQNIKISDVFSLLLILFLAGQFVVMDSSNNYDDTSDYNELFLAVHKGELSRVHSLLEKYSATETIRGRTLLHVAAARGHERIARLFIPKRDRIRDTPLHLAIRENHPEVFNLLLEEINLNARNFNDETPLHYAALYNRPEFAKTLINNGAIIEKKDSKGRTPLYAALAEGNVEVAEVLFQHGAVLSDNDLTNMGPLCNAVSKGNFEMIKLLMAKECNKVDISTKGGSPLELAVSSGRLDILEYLVKNGVKSIATVKEDKLCLFRSLIFQGSLETLKFLVDIGIKVKNLDDVFNDTFNSCRHDMWKYLVTSLSKISAKTCFKETQLHLSIRMGQLETVKSIVNEPSNEYESDTFARKLAVYIAVESGNEGILEILLNARYPVTDSLFKCISPLHLAATFEHPRLVKLLLDAGADVNLQTEDYHRTPLHFAATAAQPAVVKFLLNHGADPSKTCKCGELPLKTALQIHSSTFYSLPVSPLVFEELIKVTKMLIHYSNSETNENLFLPAVKIRISSSSNNSNPKSRELISSVGDSVFRPEIVRCVCNYLSNKKVERYSKTVLNDDNPSPYSPDVLQLMIDYNNSKSCFDIEINISNENNECQLLLIGYSKNARNLLRTISKIIREYVIGSYYNDRHYLNFNEEKKNEVIKLLRLLVCRLVLLNVKHHQTLLEECKLIDLINWRKMCLKEKRVMQSTKVNENLNFTFYDVLTKSMDKVAGYANNEDFLTAVKSSQIKFPAYADFLKANVEMAERRRNFINESTTLMYRMVKKCYRIQISTSDIRHILQYLSIVDLQRFSAACF